MNLSSVGSAANASALGWLGTSRSNRGMISVSSTWSSPGSTGRCTTCSKMANGKRTHALRQRASVMHLPVSCFTHLILPGDLTHRLHAQNRFHSHLGFEGPSMSFAFCLVHSAGLSSPADPEKSNPLTGPKYGVHLTSSITPFSPSPTPTTTSHPRHPARKSFFDELHALIRYLLFPHWDALMDFMMRGQEIGPCANSS